MRLEFRDAPGSHVEKIVVPPDAAVIPVLRELAQRARRRMVSLTYGRLVICAAASRRYMSEYYAISPFQGDSAPTIWPGGSVNGYQIEVED